MKKMLVATDFSAELTITNVQLIQNQVWGSHAPTLFHVSLCCVLQLLQLNLAVGCSLLMVCVKKMWILCSLLFWFVIGCPKNPSLGATRNYRRDWRGFNQNECLTKRKVYFDTECASSNTHLVWFPPKRGGLSFFFLFLWIFVHNQSTHQRLAVAILASMTRRTQAEKVPFYNGFWANIVTTFCF